MNLTDSRKFLLIEGTGNFFSPLALTAAEIIEGGMFNATPSPQPIKVQKVG